MRCAMKMHEVIVTGYDTKGMQKLEENDEIAGCYFCKRSSKSVVIRHGADCEDRKEMPLEFGWFDIVEDEYILKYLICNECFEFFKKFFENILFSREFRQKFTLKWERRTK